MITKIDKLEKCSKEKIEMVKWLHREKVIEVLKMRGCIIISDFIWINY